MPNTAIPQIVTSTANTILRGNPPLRLATKNQTGAGGVVIKTAQQLDLEKKKLVQEYIDQNGLDPNERFVAFHEGDNEWLSNSYPAPFDLNGISYQSPENYYQSEKIQTLIGNGQTAFLNEPAGLFSVQDRKAIAMLIQADLAQVSPQAASNAATGKGDRGAGNLHHTLDRILKRAPQPLQGKLQQYSNQFKGSNNAKPQGGFYGLNDMVSGRLSTQDKHDMMLRAQTAKYNDPRNAHLKQALLNTGSARIIEAAPDDQTFGLGGKNANTQTPWLAGKGMGGLPLANLQGHITQQVRANLQAQLKAGVGNAAPPPPPLGPLPSSPSAAPSASAGAPVRPPKCASNATTNPPDSIYEEYSRVRTFCRSYEDLYNALKENIPEELDIYLNQDLNPDLKLAASDAVIVSSIHNVMQDHDHSCDFVFDMVTNNQYGSQTADGKAHDVSAVKVEFKNKAEAEKFAQKLYHEHGIHSHTFGDGYMKTPQGKDENIIFLTKEDLEKISKTARVSQISNAGSIAYETIQAITPGIQATNPNDTGTDELSDDSDSSFKPF